MEALDNKKGKSYTLQDDKGTKALVIRNKTGTFITNSYINPLEKPTQIFGKASYVLQTKSGSIIISASQTKVSAWSTEQNKPIFEQDFKYIYSITLSPNEEFVQILDKIDSNQGKTLIFSLPKMTKVAQFKENAFTNYYQKQSYPLVKFTTDDKKKFRYNSKAIQVYDSQWKLQKKYVSGPLQFFQVNKISKENSYLIAVFFLDKKTSQGHVTLFSNDSQQPYYEKHIKKAQQIKIKFNPKNNKFLMQLQTYYDPTGKSYYGEYGLYIFNDQNKKINKVETAKGPVHDFQWDSKGQNFIVISGFMPAESIMFNQHNKQIFQFGKHHRNKIIWGNKGRLLCLAGFGNLNGQMQIWDMQTKIKIGMCKSNSASYCGWSPDDRKLLTSIVTPRLRVDNCYKIFSYTGVELFKVNFDDTELYETSWLNTQNYVNTEARGLSPNRKVQIQEKKEQPKFKSFAESLGFETFSLNSPMRNKEQPKLVPGQHPDDIPKKKKRVRNKKQPNLQATQQE